MNVLRSLLRAREQTESEDDDDSDGGDDAAASARHHRKRKLLRLRCYVCAGSGKLEFLETGAKVGRIVRCVACGGTGKITMT